MLSTSTCINTFGFSVACSKKKKINVNEFRVSVSLDSFEKMLYCPLKMLAVLLAVTGVQHAG